MADGAATRTAIETVWRMESARLLGGLLRMVTSVDEAEDLAQEALLKALQVWPSSGIPSNPGAWLMTVAKHRAIDQARRRTMVQSKHGELERDSAGASQAPADPDHIDDDVLRLMLIACHPVLSAEARVALTLRLVAGLSTAEIARAYLSAEPTIAQRIVRAKRTLAAANVPFEVPCGQELLDRVGPVHEVVYLIFNEGYSASSGDDWMRPALCQEAMRLGRVLAGLLPSHAETHGLVALMELQASRLRARVDADGNAVLLLEQDRSTWDRLLITHGLSALDRAQALAKPSGPYTLQAGIAACHARAPTADATDWQHIVALYDALVELTGSPVVALNRAMAISMADGPEAGLAELDELASEPALRSYHWLPSARADLLVKLGRHDEARRAFEAAAALTHNERERATLLARAASCYGRGVPN